VLAALPGLLQTWNGSALVPSPDSVQGAVLEGARTRANGIVGLRGGGYGSIGDLLTRMYWLLDSGPVGPAQVKLLFALSGSENDRNALAREMLERFKRISELITVRSDVFEIICTAQVGRLLADRDQNGDGVLDLRDGEFLPVAEAKVRVVYER